MIPLLLLSLFSAVLTSSSSSGSSSSDSTGHWAVLNDNLKPCIKLIAQLDLTLNYIREADDSLAAVDKLITVPAYSTTDNSDCNETVQIGDLFIESQVLQLDFPNNQGWNVRLAFTQDARMGVDPGDWALWQVNITANYSSMPEIFQDAPKNHIHTYFSVIDFNDPPEIADDESTRVGDCLYCPSPIQFIINKDPHNGPPAAITLQKVQMQAYMETDDFGKSVICADDQNELDLVPVVVSCVLAGLVLFTLVAYFTYRFRLPADILNMTEQEFAEEDHHHEKENGHVDENGNHGHANHGHEHVHFEEKRF